MDCVVAPFVQSHDAPAAAVSVTEPPWQNVVGPLAETVEPGSGWTVTVVTGDVALQPLAFMTVTL